MRLFTLCVRESRQDSRARYNMIVGMLVCVLRYLPRPDRPRAQGWSPTRTAAASVIADLCVLASR